jgi:hypothetical protein
MAFDGGFRWFGGELPNSTSRGCSSAKITEMQTDALAPRRVYEASAFAFSWSYSACVIAPPSSKAFA